ncbi:phytanoyl-CoA dioxygenase [Sphingobium xenophagum]|uniref:Phytanoyl-CoA dioxygenase n=1 Tax=Sphingobium xenophagum TaxID=121428 RepID=A0A249MY56_SPHXE|nr:phytanoyl-CoA dioxygenase family protein [Sphingobium xenophagum]ASY46049.1 phytanoyl-CoA dioxygenase [Sphingobium xenophagum]
MANLPDIAPLADHHTSALLDQGYCIIPAALPAASARDLAEDLSADFERAAASTGPFYGNDTKRFGSLLRRSPHAQAFVQHDLILAVVRQILGPWCDRVALNLTQAIELMPGSIEQVPHRDQDMWPCSRLVDPDLHVEFLVNVMWPFTSFTRDNGATRVWPGSHRRQDETILDPDEAIVAEMEPGSALLFLGSTLHAGGANKTDHPRRGMIVSYALGWLKPYELQWLAYPPDVARQFDPDLSDLIGYRIHRPNLGNYEGHCPSKMLRSTDANIGAVDALGDEQHALIEAYRREGLLPSVAPS